ncbi:MAG: hypothetical protein VB099_12925 [Candidatus Limiplasma sp.]|nr:hypothetical protein [Candidatus Limiplasma sp.]
MYNMASRTVNSIFSDFISIFEVLLVFSSPRNTKRPEIKGPGYRHKPFGRRRCEKMPGLAAGFLALVEMDLGARRQVDGLLAYGRSGGSDSFTQSLRAIGGCDLAGAIPAGTYFDLHGLRQRLAFLVFRAAKKLQKNGKSALNML